MSLVQYCREAQGCRIHRYEPSQRYFMAFDMVNAFNGTAQRLVICTECYTDLDKVIQDRHRAQYCSLTRLEKEMGYRQ